MFFFRCAPLISYKILTQRWTHLNILVLVPEVLGNELYGLGGLVRLGRQEDVADVTVAALRQRRVLLEGLAGVQLAGGRVQITQLHHLHTGQKVR
jgi:hypothetical protein